MSKQLRVYKYWAEPASLQDAQQLGQQMRLADDHRRRLALIENAARFAQRQLDSADPAVAVTLGQLRDTQNAAAIADGIDPNDFRAMKQWREDLKEVPPAVAAARDAVKAARKVLHQTDDYKESLKAINDRRGIMGRAARKLCSSAGLAWGTYQFVEEAHDQSCGSLPYWEDVDARRHPGEGVIAVHIQGRTLSCADVIGGNDTFIRVGASKYGIGARVHGFRVVRPAGQRTKSGGGAPRLQRVQLRTGSTPNRAPIWTDFHVLMHRALPPGKIVWVRAHQTRIGIRNRWNVQFVVELDEAVPQLSAPTPQAAAVGIDIGWRQVAQGWRIAYAVGSDGTAHELVIPFDVLRRAQKSSDLRSIRDQHRDRVRGLITALREVTADTWFRNATTHTDKWFKLGRFVRLQREWCNHRFVGDDVVFTTVTDWLNNDRHLIDWQEFNTVRMKHQIEGRYIEWAYALCRRYAVIGVEDLQLANLKASGKEHTIKIANRRGAVVAVSQLFDCIDRGVAKFQRDQYKVRAAYTTRDCATCGCRRPASAAQILTCPGCGETEDRDVTAAKNILTRARRAHASAAASTSTGGPLAATSASSGATSANRPRVRRTRKRLKQPTLATP